MKESNKEITSRSSYGLNMAETGHNMLPRDSSENVKWTLIDLICYVRLRGCLCTHDSGAAHCCNNLNLNQNVMFVERFTSVPCCCDIRN